MTKHQNDGLGKRGVSALFGYYPNIIDIENERCSIKAVPDHIEYFDEISSNPNIVNDWFYPGPQVREDFISGNISVMPYSARVFSLPKTHELYLHQHHSIESCDFVVWCLSFFTGMRLTTTDAGFVDATPIKPGKLVDFCLHRCTLEDAVEVALAYIDSEGLKTLALERLKAVIHALFIAQNPQALSYEKFQYLYMALDACFKLISASSPPLKTVKHADRIEWMCQKFNIPLPNWGKNSPGNTSLISIARNDAFHEALFFGSPLGFSAYGGNQPQADPGNTLLQMQALTCRLVVAILGRPHATYVSTPVDTRGIYSLELV